MGLYNTLTTATVCPKCGWRGIFAIQFKYGNTRLWDYHLGEPLRWSGNRNDVGTPGARKVIVAGIGGPCPECHERFLDFDILIEGDCIAGVMARAEERSDLGPEGFIVSN